MGVVGYTSGIRTLFTVLVLNLQIPAAHLSSLPTANRAETVYRELAKRKPALKILYVTPEKMAASQKLNTPTSLYERDLLAKFFVDEAH